MFKFSKKRFFITLGLSIGVWLISIFVQGITLYAVKFNLFSGSACEITGFPLARCIYNGTQIAILQLINIFIWFLVINLAVYWVKKRDK